MRTRFAPALVSSLLLAGCFAVPEAKSPATGAVATGEPLAVVDDVKVWTTSYQEKVGETVHKDAAGRTIGTSDSYEERTQVHTKHVWYPVQGSEQLSDEDFFRIAGEEAAYGETLDMRARAKRWNRRGKITMIVGGVGMIAGIFVPHTTGRTLLLTGGGLVLSGGWSMSYWGARQMSPEHHAVDRSIAERAARQYNQQLGTGVSATKSF
jgi:hypothetical protein